MLSSKTFGRRAVLAAAAGAGAAVVLAPSAEAAGAADGRNDTLLDWYDLTATTIGVVTGPQQVTNSRTWAIAWIAAWRAVSMVRGGADAELALAAAVHETLITTNPAATAALDAALAATLARLSVRHPDRVVAAGADAARAVLAERAGDGLDPASVNRPYPPPAAAPGVWQPTPPAFASPVQSGQGDGRPFLVRIVEPLQPGPPPDLDSDIFLRDLAESRAVGAVDSTVRTAEQTAVARFWSQSSLNGFTGALRTTLAPGGSHAGRRRPLRERVGLIALFHAATIDAQITTYQAKYRFLRWRPVTAIRTGSVDPDPDWTPLLATPAHPEYPSGHTTYAGAAQAVLDTLAGPPRAAFTLTSAVATDVTRTYRRWSELTRDNIDARVWEGVHFRNTDETGAAVGRRAALAGLARWHGRPI
ncbi:phosphoesterase PA-phosphatase [Actinoplanes sp. SE50]|uniref:vanadium-dependent haloperoxidase n=1 Tax=unclassified Actinoplanes TaxID=2626549 RepID=UPI00023EC32E|nr:MULTISPECIES: vanadium-dependent haloperoxidase [unclassified Actinoplanes]AEV86392.1 Vanadium chloroperoxidase [Actinoplanes sp. SE50/110]ATO84789.1 phosphoesterase PA-phosphatase [Actinoplanes sp. SE50]SLM02199.1 phosphoesterase PA-phosphatase [Actinoplanes sp. SE50/110]